MARRKPMNINKELADTLDSLGYDPAVKIVRQLNRIERLFEINQKVLTFDQALGYTNMLLKATDMMMPFLYGKKATKHELKSLNATVNYNNLLEDLNNKTLDVTQVQSLSSIEVDSDAVWATHDDTKA